MSRRYVLATTNRGKIREIRGLLESLPIELVGLDAFSPIEPPEETGTTFAENARLKARYYAAPRACRRLPTTQASRSTPSTAEPGVESARYGGAHATYPERFALIYDTLRRAGLDTSPARFVCIVALAERDRIAFEARGTVEGRVAPAPAGTGGFGYDPIFFFPPLGKTLAEATQAEKDAISHRGEAFRQLRRYLETARTVRN
jgi:XTP/dITP diphosphohydrolase